MQAFVLLWVMSVSVRSSTLSNCTTMKTHWLHWMHRINSHAHILDTHTRTHCALMHVCVHMHDWHTLLHTYTHIHTHHSFFLSYWQAHIPSALQGGGQRDSCHCGTSLHRHTHAHARTHTHTHTQPLDTKLTDTHPHTQTHPMNPPSYIHFQASRVQQHSSLLIDCHNGWRD